MKQAKVAQEIELQRVLRTTLMLSVVLISGVCLLVSNETSQYFPFSVLDAFALQYLPNATAFAGNSIHQQAIRVSSSLVLICAVILGLNLAFVSRNGPSLNATLKNQGQRMSAWPIMLVIALLAIFPFIPLLNPESMASVRLVAEGIRSSRTLLLLFSLISLAGYVVVWFLLFRSVVAIFRSH